MPVITICPVQNYSWGRLKTRKRGEKAHFDPGIPVSRRFELLRGEGWRGSRTAFQRSLATVRRTGVFGLSGRRAGDGSDEVPDEGPQPVPSGWLGQRGCDVRLHLFLPAVRRMDAARMQAPRRPQATDERAVQRQCPLHPLAAPATSNKARLP